ncbi:MAG TPA: hypothetical protein VLC28_14795 [Flavitalea sp.]|nr:hypothetical protein [Flavitalea sp.]
MKNCLLITLLALFSTLCYAQGERSFTFQRSFPGSFSDFTVDNLGNLYLVSQNGQLKKNSPQGDSLGVFNNLRRYGKLHSVDISNPLKVLLYYRDFQTVVILDRFLNTRSTVDLRRVGLYQVKAVAQSYDNNIWIYDEQESKLKKVGDDGRILDQTTDFRLLFDSVPSPTNIIDQNKQLYLYDSAKGVYIFDYYGGFRKRIQFTGWTDFTVINQMILGRDGKYLYRYEPGTLDLKQFLLPSMMLAAKKIVLGATALYTLDESGINMYAYP